MDTEAREVSSLGRYWDLYMESELHPKSQWGAMKDFKQRSDMERAL